MENAVTFLALSGTAGTTRRITLSKTALRLFTILLCMLPGLLGYGIYDYARLKRAAANHLVLKRQTTGYKLELAEQRRQLRVFAEEINTLKSKLLSLHQFEEKIRIIANLEKPQQDEGLFGIGGSIPEDLDSQKPLTEKHNTMIRAMHDQVDQLHQASDRQKKGFVALSAHLENRLNLLSSTPSIRPTRGWVTSRFGYRKSPFTGRRQFHAGLDIATRQGTPIIAPADGVVSFAKSKGLMGNMMVINHGHGMVTRYGHIHKFLKKRGENVRRGEKIALVGNTGRSTGPHLHYEVRLKGVPVNPQKYILD